MIVSRQEANLTKGSGRVNQKARTRAALLAAAVELVREGRPPSVPDAAERALVSVATAYRYFPTADDLWTEASFETMDFTELSADVEKAVDAAGDERGCTARGGHHADRLGHAREPAAVPNDGEARV